MLIRKLSKYYRTEQITFTGLMVGLPFCLLASFAELQVKSINVTSEAVWAILYLGIGCTAIANLTWAEALKLMDASLCSLFYPSQILFASIFGIVFLNEKIDLNFVIGGILITTGVLIGIRQK